MILPTVWNLPKLTNLAKPTYDLINRATLTGDICIDNPEKPKYDHTNPVKSTIDITNPATPTYDLTNPAKPTYNLTNSAKSICDLTNPRKFIIAKSTYDLFQLTAILEDQYCNELHY